MHSSQPILRLTVRERYVLYLLAQGLLYKEIAYDNKISIDTVKKHSKNIYKKLGAKNRTEAVMHLPQLVELGENIQSSV